MRLFPALILAMFPLILPAHALTPVPSCVVNEADGAVLPMTDPRGTVVVWVRGHPGGVVSWDWLDEGGSMQGAVQICSGGQTLRFSVLFSGWDPVRTRLDEVLESDTVYSLADLRRELRAVSARAWQTGSPGRCACESQGF